MDNDRKEMTDAQLEEIASIVRHFSVSNPWLSAKIKDLIAEVERLRAENARLKLTAKHPPAGTIQPFGETEMGKWVAEQSKRPPSNVHIGGNESLIPKE